MVKKAKSKKDSILLSRFLLILGITLILVPSFWKLKHADLSFSQAPQEVYSEINLETEKPLVIRASKIGLNLAIEESKIQNENWDVSKNGASHLVSSSVPGKAGNIVIYGHNTKNIFGNLDSLSIGDEIEVLTRDGKVHKYKIKEKKIVDPSDVEILNPTKNETLTIYTCTGLLDSKRLVLVSYPI